jgi:acetoin:2,6-dichlorophenolindophenol oxidoreductase subunit beta
VVQITLRSTNEVQGRNPSTVFVGQGLLGKGAIYGTLDTVPSSKCLEMPVAENLSTGVATGLALCGRIPIVVFQRMDFMLIAADQIINHMALMPEMSGNQFDLHVILRAIIGSHSRTFDVGAQHRHNFSGVFAAYVNTTLYEPGSYTKALEQVGVHLIVEEKDLYSSEVVCQ